MVRGRECAQRRYRRGGAGGERVVGRERERDAPHSPAFLEQSRRSSLVLVCSIEASASTPSFIMPLSPRFRLVRFVLVFRAEAMAPTPVETKKGGLA
jgi:hypothetical protein